LSKFGILSRPDGSAAFTQKETYVLSAVYGPTEVKPQNELIDQAFIDVIFVPLSSLSGASDNCWQSILHKLFQNTILTNLHPRTSIRIIIQEIQDHGGLLSCIINSACLALLNASVPMKYVVAAVHCSVDKNNTIICTPSQEQLKESVSSHTFVFESVNHNLVTTYSLGRISPDHLLLAIDKCSKESEKVFTFIRESVRKEYQK